MGQEDEFERYENLAIGIIKQAVRDWRLKIVQNKKKGFPLGYQRDFDCIREFFHGAWCACLLVNTEVTPQTILERLERELAKTELIYVKEANDGRNQMD